MTTPHLTAIDPGTDQGWAHFRDGVLTACGLGSCWFYGDVLIELPQVYRGSKVNPNDLVTLAVKVGELKYHAESTGHVVTLVWPHDWKGSTPKKIHNNRVIKRLRVDEWAVVERAECSDSKRHNVLDAVGLGLWKLGRMI